MANVFMSVVGTGNYAPAEYILEGESRTNRLVQKAILEILQEKGESFDKIVIFLTQEAKNRNWEQYNRGDGTMDEGLLPFLQKRYSPDMICGVDIPNGSTEQETQELFQKMYECIGEEDEITFDITHGFRILPILFFPLMRFAAELKNITIKHIYYGMYEAGRESTPIVDLKCYNDIMEWANAAHAFVQYGNAKEFGEKVASFCKSLPDGVKPFFAPMRVEAMQFAEFSKSILASRGSEENSIHEALSAIKEKQEGDKAPFTPLNELFAYTEKAVAPLIDALDDKVREGLAVAQWCCDYSLVQQAYTALEETITTFFYLLACPGKESIVDRENRKIVEMQIGAAINSAEEPVPEGKEEFAIIAKTIDGDPDLQETIRNIKNIRNDLNHFGMNGSAASVRTIEKSLQSHIDSIRREFAEILGKQL